MRHDRSTKARRIGLALAGLAVASTLAFHAAPAAAQLPCWTMVGSDGTVDEADLSIVSMDANTAAVSNAVDQASVEIRYNIVAVDGVFGGDRRTKTFTVRMADNGASAQVIARLQRLNISSGVVTTLAVLDSNAFPPSVVAQRRTMQFNCSGPELDFERHVYYVSVQLIKTAAGGTSLVRALQLCGNGIC